MRNSLLIALLLFILSCNQSDEYIENENDKTFDEIINVECILLQNKEFVSEIYSNGKLEAFQQAQLHFNTSGTLKEIFFKNGDFVKQGQIIAVLENSMQKTQLQEAQNILAKAEIDKSILMVDYNLENRNLDRKQLLQNIDIKSGFLQAQNKLEAAKINYEYTFLKAPFSGRIANLESQAWNNIGQGEIFCYLLNDNKLKVRFNLLESELEQIHNTQKIEIAPIYNDTVVFQAVITNINPMVDENGLISIEAELQNNKAFLLYSGMNVKIKIQNSLPKTLTIPKNALVKRSDKNIVFSIKNGKTYWNEVKLVGENEFFFAIESQLIIGDTVIVSNNLQLAHDTQVYVQKIQKYID